MSVTSIMQNDTPSVHVSSASMALTYVANALSLGNTVKQLVQVHLSDACSKIVIAYIKQREVIYEKTTAALPWNILTSTAKFRMIAYSQMVVSPELECELHKFVIHCFVGCKEISLHFKCSKNEQQVEKDNFLKCLKLSGFSINKTKALVQQK